MIQRIDTAIATDRNGVTEGRCLIIAHGGRFAERGLPALPAVAARPDHAAGAPIQVPRLSRIDGKLTIVRDDLLPRHDPALDIGGHLPPRQSRVLGAKQSAQIRHRPYLPRIGRMSDDILDPATAPGTERLPGLGGQGRGGDEQQEKIQGVLHHVEGWRIIGLSSAPSSRLRGPCPSPFGWAGVPRGSSARRGLR